MIAAGMFFDPAAKKYEPMPGLPERQSGENRA